MSQIAKRGELAADGPDLTNEQMVAFNESPLRAIPGSHAALKPVAWKFWGMWSGLIENQLPLALRLRDWIEQDGMTVDDAREVFRLMNATEKASQIKYKGEFFAELSRLVGMVIQRRRAREETEARRREAMEGEKAASDSRPFVETLTVGMFKPDKT